MTRTIIIPLADPEQDQEGIALQAIACASAIFEPHETRMLLVSAIDDEAQRANRQAYLDQIAASTGRDTDTLVERGDPAATILDVAARTDDPTIIMAS